jgi:ribosome-binding factor A
VIDSGGFMPMDKGEPYKRAGRVGDQVKAEIAEIISKKISDPRVASVTVTAVILTDDLKYARVYISPWMAESSEATLIGLTHAAGFIRKELGKRLKLRYLPELEFKLESDSPYQVLDLLEQIKTQNRETSTDEHDE